MKQIIAILILPILIFSQTTDYCTNKTDRGLYFSGLIQYGPGFEKIYAGQDYNSYTYEYNDIYIRPGGGYGIEAIIGVDMIPSIAAEIGVGYLRSGKVVHTEHIIFDKLMLRASLIYKLNIFKYHTFYIGGGYSAIQKAMLLIEQSDESFKAKYTRPKGLHLISGIQFNYTKNLYFFGDIKYYSLGEYEITDATFSYESIDIADIDSKFYKYNANGYQLSFGIGYYIK